MSTSKQQDAIVVDDDDIEEFSDTDPQPANQPAPPRKFVKLSELQKQGVKTFIDYKNQFAKPKQGSQHVNTRSEKLKELKKQKKKETKTVSNKKRKRVVKLTDRVAWITVAGHRTLLYNGKRYTGRVAFQIWSEYKKLKKENENVELIDDDDEEYVPSDEEVTSTKKTRTKKKNKTDNDIFRTLETCKEYCRKHKLPVSGKKEELIKRIKEHQASLSTEEKLANFVQNVEKEDKEIKKKGKGMNQNFY